MKNNSALFYTCSLIEFIGRKQKLKRSELVRILGKKAIERIYKNFEHPTFFDKYRPECGR